MLLTSFFPPSLFFSRSFQGVMVVAARCGSQSRDRKDSCRSTAAKPYNLVRATDFVMFASRQPDEIALMVEEGLFDLLVRRQVLVCGDVLCVGFCVVGAGPPSTRVYVSWFHGGFSVPCVSVFSP